MRSLLLVLTLLALAAACGSSSETAPEQCVWKGVSHEDGEIFRDQCNSCKCNPDGISPGEVGCSLKSCEGGCEYGDAWHDDGSQFPAGDGCNTCSCAAGAVSCTEIACGDGGIADAGAGDGG